MDAESIPGYKILEKIGEGGGGSVYRARQETLDRDVAIKILLRDLAGSEDDVQQFVNEARAAGKLSHSNIVQVYDAGECDGTCYISMEHVDGFTVGDWVKENGPMSEKAALAVATGVAEALRYAWREARLVHLDVKPDNLLLDRANAVKIADLGLAKIAGSAANSGSDEEVACTPAFCSPEIALGEEDADLRADIYSLGATLYYMVTGKIPFDGLEGSDMLSGHVSGHLPNPRQINPSVSTGMAVLIRKMMARSRGHRHANWADVLQDLARVAKGRGPRHPLLSTVDSTVKAGCDGARVKCERASANDKRKRVRIKLPVRSPVPAVSSPVKRVAPAAPVPSKRARVVKVAVSGSPHVTVPAARSSRLGPGGIGALVAVAAFVVVSIVVGAYIRSRDMAGARVQMAAAEAYRSAEAYARRNPEAYDRAIAQFRAAAEASVGTRYVAMADEEIKRLSAARQAAVDEAGRQLEERVKALSSRGLADEALRACERYTGPFAAELEESRESLADQLRSPTGLNR